MNSNGELSFTTTHFSYFALAVLPAKPVCSLTSNTSLIANNSPIDLTWSTLSASGVVFSPSIGSSLLSGTIRVTPPNNATTQYTLTASNPFGSVSCVTSVVAKPVPECSIYASSVRVKNGSPIALSWT